MNNEPIAWTDGKGNYFDKNSFFPVDDLIPLYTHPVKEQDTDCQYCKQGCIRCDARKQLTDEEIKEVITEHEWYSWTLEQFARAILRKAQEK